MAHIIEEDLSRFWEDCALQTRYSDALRVPRSFSGFACVPRCAAKGTYARSESLSCGASPPCGGVKWPRK